MKRVLSVLALAAGVALAHPAMAAGVKVGSLVCKVESGSGYIVGSSRTLDCTFTNTKGRSERYTGSIDRVGIDVGVTDHTSIGWAVFSAGHTSKGALAGTYVGVSGDASVGFGGGAKLLVGGSNHAFTLQPVSLQAQKGVNLALGLAALKLAAR